MNRASGSQKQSGSAENLYSTVWPAGAEKSDCKKTEQMAVKAERGIEFILLKTSLRIVCGLKKSRFRTFWSSLD